MFLLLFLFFLSFLETKRLKTLEKLNVVLLTVQRILTIVSSQFRKYFIFIFTIFFFSFFYFILELILLFYFLQSNFFFSILSSKNEGATHILFFYTMASRREKERCKERCGVILYIILYTVTVELSCGDWTVSLLRLYFICSITIKRWLEYSVYCSCNHVRIMSDLLESFLRQLNQKKLATSSEDNISVSWLVFPHILYIYTSPSPPAPLNPTFISSVFSTALERTKTYVNI